MEEKILVTGPTGNVGTHVVRQLLAAGFPVRTVAHSRNSIEALRKAGTEVFEADFSEPGSMHAVFEGISRVFLLTPLVPHMVRMGATLVEEAKKAGVKHIVRLSGMGADVDPGITLGRWHREVEREIENSGIAYTFLRPNSFMQTYAVFFGDSIKNRDAFYLPAGDGKVSLVDTRDVAAVAVEALTHKGHEGKAYTLTGPEALSNTRVSEILSEVMGRAIRYVDVSDESARQRMKNAQIPDWLIDVLMELYQLHRGGATSAVLPTVEQVTGKPPISFRRFALDHIEAFK